MKREFIVRTSSSTMYFKAVDEERIRSFLTPLLRFAEVIIWIEPITWTELR